MLTRVWPMFSERRLEVLLIPIGIAIARALHISGRVADAITLLEDIWECNEPFPPSDEP